MSNVLITFNSDSDDSQYFLFHSFHSFVTLRNSRNETFLPSFCMHSTPLIMRNQKVKIEHRINFSVNFRAVPLCAVTWIIISTNVYILSSTFCEHTLDDYIPRRHGLHWNASKLSDVSRELTCTYTTHCHLEIATSFPSTNAEH